MKTKLFLSMALVVALSTSTFADLSISEYTGVVQNPVNSSLTPVSGDEYFISPGLGNAGAAFLAGGGGPSFLNDATENTGPDVAATGDVLSSDLTTFGPGGSFNLTLTLASSNGSDLNPAGFVDGGGAPLDTALVFIGASGGGDPIDFLGVHTVTLATIDLLDAGGGSLTGGPVDITGFANFTAGVGGSWDGSLGVSFGAGSAGAGISSWVLSVDAVKAIPEPTSIAVLSVLGLGLVSRRRR